MKTTRRGYQSGIKVYVLRKLKHVISDVLRYIRSSLARRPFYYY